MIPRVHFNMFPSRFFCRSRLVVGLALACGGWIFSSGCAVHYYSPSTGTEHVWGVGHMKFKKTAGGEGEGVQAVVTGMEVYGVGARVGAGRKYLMLGWLSDQELTAVDEHVSIRFEDAGGGLFRMRVGTRPPWEENENGKAKGDGDE